jgi:WD40-like Beta Propeller Repeat
VAGSQRETSTAQKVDEIDGNNSELNTAFPDGCPIQSPDGLSLYMATNRPGGGQGLLDIWVARRETVDSPFGPPENLPAPINSAADDFCPTPVRGEGLFFVSRRTTDERRSTSAVRPDRKACPTSTSRRGTSSADRPGKRFCHTGRSSSVAMP